MTTKHLDWLLLTKRPRNFWATLRRGFERFPDVAGSTSVGDWHMGELPGNAWFGVSVEDQEYAAERLAHAALIPAPVLFVSAEPLLGPIDFSKIPAWRSERHRLWVIVGGESGPRARPCDVRWIRSIVEQCQDAGVPCFVKQLGSWPVGYTVGDEGSDIARFAPDYPRFDAPARDPKGGDPAEWPAELRVRELPASFSLRKGVNA